MVPCGTPLPISVIFIVTPSTTTLCLRSIKRLINLAQQTIESTRCQEKPAAKSSPVINFSCEKLPVNCIRYCNTLSPRNLAFFPCNLRLSLQLVVLVPETDPTRWSQMYDHVASLYIDTHSKGSCTKYNPDTSIFLAELSFNRSFHKIMCPLMVHCK